jgi:hypothetical protein
LRSFAIEEYKKEKKMKKMEEEVNEEEVIISTSCFSNGYISFCWMRGRSRRDYS